MTDRINGVLVTLEGNIRVDDAEYILNAIRMIKGVIDVTPNVADIDHHMAYSRARIDLQGKIYDALKES